MFDFSEIGTMPKLFITVSLQLVVVPKTMLTTVTTREYRKVNPTSRGNILLSVVTLFSGAISGKVSILVTSGLVYWYSPLYSLTVVSKPKHHCMQSSLVILRC